MSTQSENGELGKVEIGQSATVIKLLVEDGEGLQSRDLTKEFDYLKPQDLASQSSNEILPMLRGYERRLRGHHPHAIVLGFRLENRETLVRSVLGSSITYASEDPVIENYWLGHSDRTILLTPSEAAQMRFGSNNALYYIMELTGGVSPEMIIRGRSGIFYPATSRDKIIPLNLG